MRRTREDPALGELAAIPVEACMTPDPVTVSVTDSCRWALAVMSAAGIHHVPVLDAGRLVGIVTEADVLRRAPSPASPDQAVGKAASILDHTSIAGVMTYAPVTISRAASLASAISVMVSRGVGGLPVVDGDTVVGIVTHADVLRQLTDALSPHS